MAGTGRELQALTGHTGSIDRVRFHPTEANVLCTASSDRSARLWDIRSAGTSRSGGKIDLGAGIVSVEWNPAQRGSVRHLAVTDRDDMVRVYDGRKLSKPVSAVFAVEDGSIVHETYFSPSVVTTRRTREVTHVGDDSIEVYFVILYSIRVSALPSATRTDEPLIPRCLPQIDLPVQLSL